MEVVPMDANGGGIGKAASELLQEMQKAQQELQKLEQTKGGGQTPGVSFDNVMQAQGAQGANQVTSAQHATQVNQAAQILQTAKANATLPSTRVGAAEKAER